MNVSCEMFAVEFLELYKLFFDKLKDTTDVKNVKIPRVQYYNSAKYIPRCRAYVFNQKFVHFSIDGVKIRNYMSQKHQSLKDIFENEVYELYITDTLSRNTFDHIISGMVEKDDHTYTKSTDASFAAFMEMDSNPTSTPNDPCKTSKLDEIWDLRNKHMGDICNILRLRNPYDTTTTMTDPEVYAFINYFEENENILKLAFRVKVRAKCSLKIQQGITILSSIFQTYCGLTLTTMSSHNKNLKKHARGNSRTANKDYVCQFANLSRMGVCVSTFVSNWNKT